MSVVQIWCGYYMPVIFLLSCFLFVVVYFVIHIHILFLFIFLCYCFIFVIVARGTEQDVAALVAAPSNRCDAMCRSEQHVLS